MPEDKSYDPYVVDEYIFLFKFYIQFKRNEKQKSIICICFIANAVSSVHSFLLSLEQQPPLKSSFLILHEEKRNRVKLQLHYRSTIKIKLPIKRTIVR